MSLTVDELNLISANPHKWVTNINYPNYEFKLGLSLDENDDGKRYLLIRTLTDPNNVSVIKLPDNYIRGGKNQEKQKQNIKNQDIYYLHL
jgi:hypothetical protein